MFFLKIETANDDFADAPAGQCPDCGALSYLITEAEAAKE